MSCKTVEVELENGRVRPSGPEALPAKAHALLTLLDSNGGFSAARTCGELADQWDALTRLPLDEAENFANDIEQARANLPPLKSGWD